MMLIWGLWWSLVLVCVRLVVLAAQTLGFLLVMMLRLGLLLGSVLYVLGVLVWGGVQILTAILVAILVALETPLQNRPRTATQGLRRPVTPPTWTPVPLSYQRAVSSRQGSKRRRLASQGMRRGVPLLWPLRSRTLSGSSRVTRSGTVDERTTSKR
jgi:hypothetical protein